MEIPPELGGQEDESAGVMPGSTPVPHFWSKMQEGQSVRHSTHSSELSQV